MTRNSLEITVSNLDHQIMRNNQQLEEGSRNSELMHRTTQLYRDLACGRAVLLASKSGFEQALKSAVKLYETMQCTYLKMPLDPYYLTRGRAEPFLYAIAIEDFQAATRMTKLMPVKANPRMECEEDFDYFRVLELLIQPEKAKSELEEAMMAFKGSAGDESHRYNLLSSMQEKDQDIFDEAFDALVQERVDYFDSRREPGSLDPYIKETSAHVFVEGIALLKIAKRFGMLVRRYRFIPEYLV